MRVILRFFCGNGVSFRQKGEGALEHFKNEAVPTAVPNAVPNVFYVFGGISNKSSGSVSRTRTYDRAINSRLLYQLSYHGTALERA